MEVAIDGSKWLLDKVLNLLADDLVAGYVASRELGLNFDTIKRELLTTQALLHAAQERGVSANNSGLQGLLQELRKKGDEAEDVLDELHYLRIRDKLHGTNKFDPWVPDNLPGQVLHGRHALRHTVGNCFSCFSCSSTQDDADSVDDVIINNPNKAMSNAGHDVDHLDRVAMSNKIKSVIEGIQSLCQSISMLLPTNASTNNRVGSMGVTVGRRHVTGPTPQSRLYGRDAIFKQVVSDMTNNTTSQEPLSVLPIFGMGGVGKTSFAQHLYNHEKIKEHFKVRIWICVSTNFDVLELTKGILRCIDRSNRATESDNLGQLQESIVNTLKSKRFLIVLDDIWELHSLQEWETLLVPLKSSELMNKGNMILVTTRFRSTAQKVKTNNWIPLEGLEHNAIMSIFQEYIFDQVRTESYDHRYMIEIARKIAAKMKGSPLAAKTLVPLLNRDFSEEHWKGILERQEWLDEKNVDGIMPALKISYNYLPFDLKKCFPYFGLFPEDYMFHNSNITQFWVAIGIINKNEPEVEGLKYLEQFVDHGFLVKVDDESGPSYVMHDLLHELSRYVSSQECANINSTSLRACEIPRSIQHLSITVGKYDENFEEEMDQLRRKVDIGRLRSLMIFGDTSASIDTILKNTFSRIKRVRVLSIILRSDESWPQNFSELIHLRYLRISYPYRFGTESRIVSLPTTISALYHLKFLKIDSFRKHNLPRNFSRLVSLRHFIAPKELHSNVPEVGEMKYLQELKEFHVKKESVGFEVEQLGKLRELGGELHILGLEKVETIEEASKAELRRKKNLRYLTLEWSLDGKDLDMADNVIDGFEPHPNLTELYIVGHPGVVGPTWLCCNICTTSLEYLHLYSISWNVLPPFGLLPRLKELKLRNISGMSQFGPDFGGVTETSFMSLMTIEFQDMPDLVKWVAGPVNYPLFSRLERIKCSSCPKLSVLPFSECTYPSNTVWFPNLCNLIIEQCPELSLPPLPHTPTLTDIEVRNSGNTESFLWSFLRYVDCSLSIRQYNGLLTFQNMDKVAELDIADAPQISLTDLRKVQSLRCLSIDESVSVQLSNDLVLPSVEELTISGSHLTGSLLPNVFKCFPGLEGFHFSGTNFMRFSNEEEYEAMFPSNCSLRWIRIYECGNLVLPFEDGGGFGCLASLNSISFERCGKIFSRWGGVGEQGINPFPDSLRHLEILEEPSMRSMDLIRNLTSLSHLGLRNCHNLTVDGFNPHITLNLKYLTICNYEGNHSIAADLFTEVARIKPLTVGFFHHLEDLCVDSIAAVLVDPICKLLSAKLATLKFDRDTVMESFTEEQDKALQQLASLQELQFIGCSSLQCLPEGLHRLRSLKKLNVYGGDKIRSLPQNGFPASLKELRLLTRNNELKEAADKIDRRRYPNLRIY